MVGIIGVADVILDHRQLIDTRVHRVMWMSIHGFEPRSSISAMQTISQNQVETKKAITKLFLVFF